MEKAYEEQQTGFIIASKDRFKSTLDRWTVHNPIRSPDIIFFMCVFAYTHVCVCSVWFGGDQVMQNLENKHGWNLNKEKG